MNATQIIKENRKPNTRYATNANENVIAQWLNDRWTIIHIYTLDGKWINGGDGLLVNGKPIVAQEDFIEVVEEPIIQTMTVQIKEGDQLVFNGKIEDAPQTPFIADLIRDAMRSDDGMAEREDADGCLVTCVTPCNVAGAIE